MAYRFVPNSAPVYNEAKDEQSRRKHGVSLSEAVKLKWEGALTWPDNRRNYGEARMVALATMGAMGARLYCVVYFFKSDRLLDIEYAPV